MAQPLIDSGRLFQVAHAPEFVHPAYMVFPRESDSEELRQAVEGLREMGRNEEHLGASRADRAKRTRSSPRAGLE
jgi:hypothetical protein